SDITSSKFLYFPFELIKAVKSRSSPRSYKMAFLILSIGLLSVGQLAIAESSWGATSLPGASTTDGSSVDSTPDIDQGSSNSQSPAPVTSQAPAKKTSPDFSPIILTKKGVKAFLRALNEEQMISTEDRKSGVKGRR